MKKNELYNILLYYGDRKEDEGCGIKYLTHDGVTISIYDKYPSIYLIKDNKCTTLNDISEKFSQHINILQRRRTFVSIQMTKEANQITKAANTLLLMKNS